MRAFLAIDLPEPVIAALARIGDGIGAGLATARPSAPETLHVTLAFLGDQPEAALQALHEELERICVPPFSLKFNGLGAFGGDRPRLLFADVVPSAALKALHGDVLRALRRAGLAVPKDRFHPHVTLARLKGAGPREAAAVQEIIARFGALPIPDAPVTGFGLYRSTLHPKGARHDLLETYGAPVWPDLDGPPYGD